jgi:hypothetical protein
MICRELKTIEKDLGVTFSHKLHWEFSYATQVWSSNHHSQLNRRIERVQRRATKWILRIKTGEIPYKQRLMTLKLLPLTYDREIKDLVFFYKTLHGHIDLKMDSYVSFIEHRRTRLSQDASVVLQTPLLSQSMMLSYLVRAWSLVRDCPQEIVKSVCRVCIFVCLCL